MVRGKGQGKGMVDEDVESGVTIPYHCMRPTRANVTTRGEDTYPVHT